MANKLAQLWEAPVRENRRISGKTGLERNPLSLSDICWKEKIWYLFDRKCGNHECKGGLQKRSPFSRHLLLRPPNPLGAQDFQLIFWWPLILPTSGLPTGRQSWGRQFWVHQSSGLPTLIMKTYFDMFWTIPGKYNNIIDSSAPLQSAILFPSFGTSSTPQ